MTDWLSYVDNPFLLHALIAAVLIGFTNGFYSGVVVLRRAALSVSALSHTLLPGIALAIAVTGMLSQISAFIGALFAALMVGVGSLLISMRGRVTQGTALAILYTTSFAAGVAALPKLDTSRGLDEWLFGDILGVTSADLWICLGIGMVTLLSLVSLMRPVLLTLFEPNVAAAQGVPTKWIQLLLFTLLILTMVASLQAVGCVLSVGILVAPGASVMLWTNNPRSLFWLGGIVGAAGCVVGLFLADMLNLAAGPTMTVTLGAVFALSFLLSPKSGLFFGK